MKRKVLAILLALVLVAALFAGCSSDGSSSAGGTGSSSQAASDGSGTGEPSGEIVTIEYVSWEPGEESNPIIQQFMDENPDIKVNVTILPDSNNTAEALDIIAMGGGEMDVWPMQSGSQFQRMQKGMLLSVDEYLAADGFDMEASFGSYAEWAQYGGSYYGVPGTASVGMMFYNKDIFDEAGVEYPTENWTIEEYMEKARALTSGSGGSKVYGTFQNMFPEEWGIYGAQVESLYGADGLSNFTTDNADFIASLELRKTLDDEGVEIPYGQIVSNFTFSSIEFLSGRAAMTPGYSWVVRDMKDTENYAFDFNVGVCYFPRISEDAPAKPSQVAVGFMGIPTTAKNPEAAWRFIKYYAEHGGIQTAQNGNIPTYMPAYSDEMIDAFIEGSPLTREQGEMFFATDMHTYTAVPTGAAAGEYSSIINEEVAQYFTGEKGLEDTVNSIKERADAAIEAEQNG